MTRTTQAIDDTAHHLGWCNTIPHTLDRILALHTETIRDTGRPLRHGLSVDQILTAIGRTERMGSGGHSDPTARAALAGEPDAIDDADETIGRINAALETCAAAARCADDTCADAIGEARWAPPAVTDRQAMLAQTISRCHRLRPRIEPAMALLDATEQAWLDHEVRVAMAESAEWVRRKAEDLWSASRGERKPVAVQRQLEVCRIHHRHGYHDDGDVVGGVCADCREFQHRHKCWPTEAILRRWDNRQAATPGMILEAKATPRRRRGA